MLVMKQIFLPLVLFAFVVACCSQKHSGRVDPPIETNNHTGKTHGMVSHKYISTGCGTVVIVNWQHPDSEFVLIPLDTLSPDLDKDGLEIYFNYQPLKRPNPPGCATGNPAKLTDIEKK